MAARRLFNKNGIKNFLRYINNELTDRERNAFERELQKDPFTDEASEGISLITAREAIEDLGTIKKHLRKRTRVKRISVYYRIAATVAVLMVISSVVIIITRTKPEKQLSDLYPGPEQFEINKSQPIKVPFPEKTKSEIETAPVKREPEVPFAVQKRAVNNESISAAPDTNSSAAVQSQKNFDRFIAPREKIFTIAQNAALSQSRAIDKKATDSGAKENINKIEDNAALPSAGIPSEEIRSYFDIGTENGNLPEGYIPPQPVTGKAGFEKYIRENMNRPDTSIEGQRVVVVLSFHVHTDGTVDSLKIIRSPGKSFSDEAVRLIKSGPAWKAATENGIVKEDEVRVRIIFR